jgi:hypothetical protein
MLRFRLRTLLIAVAVLAMPMAWVGYSLRWIEERHRALGEWHYRLNTNAALPYPRTNAPGCLWLFGEMGFSVLHWSHDAPGTREEIERLFPEAEIREIALSASS